MPSGSLAIAKERSGTAAAPTGRIGAAFDHYAQYCAGWVRQLENMALAVPAELAARLPERAAK